MSEKKAAEAEKRESAPHVLDHEHRIYGWMHQVVRDMRNDVLWAMAHTKDVRLSGATMLETDVAALQSHNIEQAAARAKLHQVVTYCNAALAEADRQMAEWQADLDARKQAALTLGGVRYSPRHASPATRALAGLEPEERPLFLVHEDDRHVDRETGSDARLD